MVTRRGQPQQHHHHKKQSGYITRLPSLLCKKALVELVCGLRPLYLLVLLLVVSPSLGFQFGEVQESCCYGDRVVEHGHVALNLPSCCARLVCRQGRIVQQDVSSPGDTHCCEFDGFLYHEGSQLSAQCMPLKCKGGYWTLTDPIDDCCKHCYLYNDPHISTFDGYNYDWHGTCNYTVTQAGLEMGVFSDFVPCNGDASCLAHTTFKDNPHTVIAMRNNDVHKLTVNGDDFIVPAGGVHVVRSSGGRHPVLSWREEGCVFLLGSSKLVVQHCKHRLDVWAYPSHTNHLCGLCGPPNSYQDDDFTDRLAGLHLLNVRPQAFPESWRTREQSDHRCRGPCPHCYQETTEDPCRAGPEERAVYSHRCKKLLHPIIGRDTELLPNVRNCAFDVCMMHQNGASDDEVEQWLVEVQILVQQNKIILARTHDGQRPNIFPLQPNTQCTPNSHWKVLCNWCWCREAGGIACTLIGCLPDYVHKFREDACDDDSRWRVDECNSCLCVRGGTICSLHPCDERSKESNTDFDIFKNSPKPELCFLDPDAGPCEALIQNYAYNRVTNRCEEFIYGGCLGNKNNFDTQKECWETCGGKTDIPKPEQCLLAKDSGPCYGSFPRFAYNDETDKCELFIYGGCHGNSNNFKSVQKCEELCKGLNDTGSSKEERCFLEEDSGPCFAHINRYAYNRVTEKCQSFVYGGCLGNDNNFLTLQDCWEACGGSAITDTKKPEKCLKDKDPGPCRGQLRRFAYNQATGQCEKFVYGGCRGNDNNFDTLEECQKECGLGKIVCDEPVCPVGCQITIDVTNGCPTCSCIECPQVKCSSTCQIIVDPQTGCESCKCRCPEEQFSDSPQCPLDCATRVVVDEKTGCERCECDPNHPGNPYFFNGCPEEPSCPADCPVIYTVDEETGCRTCTCKPY